MLRTNWKTAVFTVACLGLMTPVQGDQISDMQVQIDALRAELSQVKSTQGDNWLNERRAEEVKGLIMEVLSDADMRASLAGDGMLAGYDGHHFFLHSADGAFALYLGGQIDFRYIYNNQDDTRSSAAPVDKDEDVGGFQTRRLKLHFDGHVSSPKVGYHIVLENESGTILLEEYNVSHQINDNVNIAAGLMKLPFLREELISSTRQLAVERSTTNEFFTLNRAEGVRLRYSDGPLLINFMLSDGRNSGNSDFDGDTAELALTGRVDYLLKGEREQLDDFTGWSGEGEALNIGVAYHMEYGDSRGGGDSDYRTHTIDAQWENGPVNLFFAYIGASLDRDTAGNEDFNEMDGIVVQGGVHIVPDKIELFARWEMIDSDQTGSDEFDAFTCGFNYYINGHRTKFTADVVVLNEDAPDSTNVVGSNFHLNGSDNTGLGLIDGNDGEVAVRTQLQLLF